MDKSTTDTFVNKLEEFIGDEDKIVTVPWLCTTLNINPKDSKHLLEQYVSHRRKLKPTDLAVSYTISGICNDVLSMSIVKEDVLDDKKDLYIGEPIVEIYSVQKSREINLHGIALVDYFDVHNPREKPIKGSLISKNCTKRQFKAKKELPVPSASTIKEKPSVFSKVPPKTAKTNANTTQSPKSTNVKTNPVRKGPANSFTQYFTNDQLDINDKQQSDIKKSSDKTTPDVKTDSQKSLQSLVDSDSEDDQPSAQVQRSESTKTKVTETKRPRKKTTKKNNSSSKRRKRIVVEDESDEDIFANDEVNEEEEEMSRKRKTVIEDSEEDEPVIKPEPPVAPKNKKRKLVDRTFEDSDGYVITKKEWVEESASEEEVIPDPKVEIKAVNKDAKTETEQKLSRSNSDVAKNEKVVNGKGQGGKGKKAMPTNQPTLMNFFKRK